MTTLARPGTVPVKTVKTKAKAPALTPYQLLLKQNSGPMPSLPNNMTPTSLMTGLMNRDWTGAASKALQPAYASGLSAINFTLQKALGDAAAKQDAMQSAYLAAGGQMPHVGSEYSSLGDVLSGFAGATAPGMTGASAAGQLAAAGAPASNAPPVNNPAGAQYMFGTAPADALRQSGYYQDLGLAGHAAAEQMQGREQGMVLNNQLRGQAMTDYLGAAQNLTADMASKIPELGIAMSGEARAQAAGALSGLQFQTEARLNIQKLIQNYAQMRASAQTAGQKLALDKWAAQQLAQYHNSMATASNTRANTAKTKAGRTSGLTADAHARLMEKADAAAQKFFYGMWQDPQQKNKLVPGNQVIGFNPADTSYKPGQGAKSFQEALTALMSTYSLSREDALTILGQYYTAADAGYAPTGAPPKTPVGPWTMPGTTTGSPFGPLTGLFGG